MSSLSLARFISNQPNLSIHLTGLLQNYKSFFTEWIFQCFMIYFKILYFLVISTLIWSEDLQEVECEWIRLWVSLWPKFNLGQIFNCTLGINLKLRKIKLTSLKCWKETIFLNSILHDTVFAILHLILNSYNFLEV